MKHTVQFLLVVSLSYSCAHKSGHRRNMDRPNNECVRVAIAHDDSVAEQTPREHDGAEVKKVTNLAEQADNELARLLTPAPSQILIRKGYTTSYNKVTLAPNWVAWNLTSEHISGPANRRSYDFVVDPDVSSPKAMPSDWDYQETGYQRGHMCPSGDNKWDSQAMAETFLLTNICQQDGSLNGGDWKDLEEKCRKWVIKFGSLYIVCGPVFYTKDYKRIGANKIAVPDAFYKVILRLTPYPNCIGFLYPNKDDHHPMKEYLLTVDKIESITGIDFFPFIDDDIETSIESISDLSKW